MKTSKKHPIISYVNYRRRMRHLKHFLCLLAPLIIASVTIFVISSTGLQITSEGQMFLFSTDAAGLEENVKNLNKGVIPEELWMTSKDEGFPLSENAAIDNETDKGEIRKEEKIIISEELRKIFGTRGFPLSENATISKETEIDEWVTTNEEKIYTIRKENKTLNISKGLSLSKNGNCSISSGIKFYFAAKFRRFYIGVHSDAHLWYSLYPKR